MAQMNGVFCFTVSQNVFNPINLIKFLNSFADFEVSQDKSVLGLRSGLFVCLGEICAFRLNYDYQAETEEYNVSLNRYNGSGYIAAKMMKSVCDKLKADLGVTGSG